jgi:ATP-dependent helicase/DNAse subunit B
MEWLYSRVFRAEEYSLEAALLDDISLGLLYHRIMENLFAKIKQEDISFESKHLDTYKRWALEITQAAIKEEPAFRGPLAFPLVSPQAAGMAVKIAGILELEAKYFDGYRVGELELPVSLKTRGLSVRGIIDRVSISPDGEPVIIDYKTTWLPEQKITGNPPEVSLSEFQMPLYVKLYEEHAPAKTGKGALKVRGAFFYSINEKRIRTVMGKISGGRTKAPDREEYEPILEAAQNQIEEFEKNVKALDFVPRETRIRDCYGCVYKTACRTVYF